MVDREKLKVKRESLGLRKRKVANALGVSPANYGQKESGELSFKEHDMIALAEVLDLSKAEILDILFAPAQFDPVGIDDTFYFDVGILKAHLDHFDKELEVVDGDDRKLSGYKATEDRLILMFD